MGCETRLQTKSDPTTYSLCLSLTLNIPTTHICVEIYSVIKYDEQLWGIVGSWALVFHFSVVYMKYILRQRKMACNIEILLFECLSWGVSKTKTSKTKTPFEIHI